MEISESVMLFPMQRTLPLAAAAAKTSSSPSLMSFHPLVAKVCVLTLSFYGLLNYFIFDINSDEISDEAYSSFEQFEALLFLRQLLNA